MVAAQALAESKSMQERMNMDLDFFGNKRGWVPNLAFEVTFKLFETEVKRNIKLLYLSHKIKRQAQEGLLKLEDIEKLQEEYRDKIEHTSSQVSQMINQSVVSRELVEELKVAQDEFSFELNKIQKEIEAEARHNLRPRNQFMNNAVKIFAAASKAIPVGQPTLAAVGMGVEFIHHALDGSQSAGDILRQVPDIYKNFEGANLDDALRKLNIAMDEMSPRHIPSLRTMEQKKEYIRKVKDFTMPVFNAVSKQIEEQKKRQVSQSALNREIQKLEQRNPRFQELTKKLNVLLLKKSFVVKKIKKFLMDISSLQNDINQDSSTIAYLFDDIALMSNKDLTYFVEKMSALYTKSLRRIQYYDYLLNKSFSYRFLQEAPGNQNLSIAVEKTLKRIDESGKFTDHIEDLWIAYKESISDYIEVIVKKLEKEGPTQQMSVDLTLTEAEVKELNQKREIYINLVDRNLFGKNQENLRIKDIQLLDEFRFLGSRDDFEVEISHSGKTLIEKGEDEFFFDVSGRKTYWVWSSHYFASADNLYHNKISSYENSLLSKITATHTDIQQAFALPGAKGYIKIKLNKAEKLKVGNLIFKIDYIYQNKDV